MFELRPLKKLQQFFFQLKTLSDQHEKSIFQIQELKMKIAEVVDDQKSADKNLKASQQEVKQIL